MAWFKVDDNFAFHSKAIMAGNAALGLWVRAGSWSMQMLTDGFVPTAILRQLGTTAQAKKLVEVGLWEVAPGGYCFHEWADRQPSRSLVEVKREAWRSRQTRARRTRERNGSAAGTQREHDEATSGSARDDEGNPDDA